MQLPLIGPFMDRASSHVSYRGENQWPEKPVSFRAQMEDWIGKMKALGMVVMEAWVSLLIEIGELALTPHTISSYVRPCHLLICAFRMADGLGMNAEEWQELRSMVEDSFWVMRVIGMCNVGHSQRILLTRAHYRRSGYPPLPEGAEGVSCGAHKDYGCLT